MPFDNHKNFAKTTVATAPSPATTGLSLVVAAGEGANLPTGTFNVVVWPDGDSPTIANAEVCRATRTVDTLAIVRQQEGSPARTIVVGDQVCAALTARSLTDIETSAGGGNWELIAARAMSSQTVEDFIGLSGYSEILVMAKAVTKGTTGTLNVRVSTDNGSTFLAASGDYVNIAPSTGVEGADFGLTIQDTNATAARSGWTLIHGFNLAGTVKFAYNAPTATFPSAYITTTTALNAIRVYAPTALGGGPSATMPAGTIYVLGKR